MANETSIKRYTLEEIRAKRDRGEDRTDWNRLDRMTEAELEASIATDPDWKDIPEDWYKDAIPVTPAPSSSSPSASTPTSSPGSAPKAPATRPA